MRDDRRSAERLALAADRELTLAAMLGGVPLVASVRNLSRKGLRVALPPGSPAPDTGGVLSDAFLGPADAQGVRLGSLTVPLVVRGGHARGLFYARMATTEGAMVASATRGATAITRAGGVTARVIRQQMMRVPLFVLPRLEATLVFARWVRDHLEELQA